MVTQLVEGRAVFQTQLSDSNACASFKNDSGAWDEKEDASHSPQSLVSVEE